jgi:hypothetical protein
MRIGSKRGLFLSSVAAMAASCVLAGAAQADHHLIQIREVHRGTTASGDYVELQMFADGQNVALNTHYLAILTPDGAANYDSPLPNVAVGLNQHTVLIGNTGVAGADLNDAGVAIPASGAVCYDETNGYNGTNGLDCAAWGSFTGGTHPLSSPGLPVALPGVGLAPGQTLVRSICRGNTSQLDFADDTNNSAADFALGTGNPRNNAAAPSETPCAGTTTKKCKKKKKKHHSSAAQVAKKKHKKCKKKKKHHASSVY